MTINELCLRKTRPNSSKKLFDKAVKYKNNDEQNSRKILKNNELRGFTAFRLFQ